MENKQVSNQLCMTSERGVIYMKNVVVIYKSKYGSTKKYAKWL
ncbi:hypothetical protein QSP12_02660 [Clostridioides difficile]|nr:hypothetical protein [Clostridioides difficile]